MNLKKSPSNMVLGIRLIGRYHKTRLIVDVFEVSLINLSSSVMASSTAFLNRVMRVACGLS